MPEQKLFYELQGIICSSEGQRVFYLCLTGHVVHSSLSTSILLVPIAKSRVCTGAVSAVDKPLFVCVMSIAYHVLAVFLALVKIQLSPSNSRLLLQVDAWLNGV